MPAFSRRRHPRLPAPPAHALAVPQPIWNVANSSMRDFFLEKLVAPLAVSPAIDGVFYDCFNWAYDMITPWGRHATNIPNCTSAGGPGCEALLSGTLDLARRIALALNAAGKVPMFSNAASFANPTRAPIWLDEQRLVDALSGTQYLFNYEFFRAEQAASTFELPNLLQEAALGIPVGLHTYLNNLTENPMPHLAAFMVFRQEQWYSFVSTGWLDHDWIWEPAFDELSMCGLPLGNATGAPAPLVFTRAYERCSFAINCTVTTACTTTANMGGAELRGPMRAAHGGASEAARALKRAT